MCTLFPTSAWEDSVAVNDHHLATAKPMTARAQLQPTHQMGVADYIVSHGCMVQVAQQVSGSMIRTNH